MDRIQAPDTVTLRARLSAWARHVYAKNKYRSVVAMSKEMDYNQGALNQLIAGKGTVGLDFAIKLALVGRESLDTICFRDPGQEYFRPGRPELLPAPAREHPVVIHEPAARYATPPKASARKRR